MLQQPHVGHGVERRTSSEDKAVAPGRSNEEVDNVDERVFEHHLGGSRFVEPVAGIGAMLNVLETQYGIGIPHVLLTDRRSQNTDQRLGVGLTKHMTGPV